MNNAVKPNPGRSMAAQLNMQQDTYSYNGQELDFVYYDTQKMVSTISQHSYFTQGKGKPFTAGGNKTLADTNILTGQGIPQGQKLEVAYIGSLLKTKKVLTEAEMQKLIELYQETVVTFKIENIDRVHQVTLQELTGMNQAAVIVPAVAGDNNPATFSQVPWKYYKLNSKITLAALTSFELIMDHEVAPDSDLDDTKISLCLRGKLSRLS